MNMKLLYLVRLEYNNQKVDLNQLFDLNDINTDHVHPESTSQDDDDQSDISYKI